MKTDVTTYGSFAQSRKLAPAVAKDPKPLPETNLGTAAPKSAGPDYKLDLSSAQPPSAPAPAVPSPSAPELKLPKDSATDAVKSKLEQKVESEAKETVAQEIKEEVTAEAKEVAPEKKAGTLQKPVIVFIKGLDIFSSPSTSETGYAGVGKMADSVKGSRLYGWDQKDEILKEIAKVATKQPVILVGHSFGADTAVEIANDLNSLEHQFRTVDLLVTIDSVGFNNDIIPQNVKKNLNVFGQNNFFLNDGPNVAKRHDKTDVKNILSHLDHTDMDDDKEIQFEIVNLIQQTLGAVS